MSNLRTLCLFLMLTGFFMFWVPAWAQVVQADSDPLTVTDVLVDKTDKNAVAAREAAIAEAQHLAFQRLAERSMAPEVFKTYRLPDDRTIMLLVRDFEIKDERISTKRYSANFTVRFVSAAANYISAGGGMVRSATAEVEPATKNAAIKKTILILPYLVSDDGKKTLWSDPNPWREAWQKLDTVSPDFNFIVPAGDISDISLGDATEAWTGSYEAIEKLQEKYKADEVLLLAANHSSEGLHIERAIYSDGDLEPELPLTLIFQPQNGKNVFDEAARQAFEKIDAPALTEAQQASAADPIFAPSASVSVPAVAGEPVSIRVMMSFGDFAQWIEAQKRISSLAPRPKISISTLSTNAARFLLEGDIPGGIPGLQEKLSQQGLTLEPPAGAAGGPYTLTMR